MVQKITIWKISRNSLIEVYCLYDDKGSNIFLYHIIRKLIMEILKHMNNDRMGGPVFKFERGKYKDNNFLISNAHRNFTVWILTL